MGPNASGRIGCRSGHAQGLRSERPCSVSAEMKARQSSKIRELAEAVEAAVDAASVAEGMRHGAEHR
jgi:hypothetical protein